MSDTSQIALIRKLYDAMGDVNSFKSLLADDAEYDIAEGFPNGGVYRGIDGVSDFFTFSADFDEFYAKGDEYFESGDHVIVLGRYPAAVATGLVEFFTKNDLHFALPRPVREALASQKSGH